MKSTFKRVSAMLLAVMLIFTMLALPASAVSRGDSIVVATPVLNVRNSPSASAGKVGSVYQGNTFTVYEQRGNWSRIGSGRWVCSDYCRRFVPIDPFAGATATIGRKNHSAVNVRRGPSTNCDVVGKYAGGTTGIGRRYYCDGGWYYVYGRGIEGWVFDENVYF